MSTADIWKGHCSHSIHILSIALKPSKIKEFSIIFGTMGELKIIIWVILGIIYLVSRLRKKEPAAPPKPMDENPTEQPMTFEELLREIQTGKQAKEVKSVPEPVAPYTNYDDEVK